MGSTSALTSHLQLNNTRYSFKCLNSSRNQRTSLQFNRRKALFGVSRRREHKKSVCVACFAVDDEVTKQQEQLPGGGAVGSAVEDRPDAADGSREATSPNGDPFKEGSGLYDFLYPSKELLPDDKEMSLFDHLEELRQRIFVSVLAVGGAMLGCFAFSKDLIIVLEAPVKEQGVRFLQLAPGEFFFTTLKVSGYCGLLLGSPIILYEIIAFILPGLTKAERRFLGPIVFGSSILFYAGISFSYLVLTPAALNFFVNYAEGAVESLWSIDQYFEFVLVLMFSTGLSFQCFTLSYAEEVQRQVAEASAAIEEAANCQREYFAADEAAATAERKVPVIQLLLGQVGLVTGDQMLSIWRYVVVGAVVAAAVLTPSTDPLTQILLAGPLLGLYLGGAWAVKLTGR